MADIHSGTAFQNVIHQSRIPLALASARDDEHPLLAFNAGLEDLTGYSAGDAIGRNCRFLARKAPGSDQHGTLREALSRKIGGLQAITNDRKSGEEFLNFVTVVPLYGLNGVVEYFLGSQIDVTQETDLAGHTLRLRAHR